MAKTLTGVVVSDKGDKTIVIKVTISKTHPIYKKQFFVSKKIMAHDEKNQAHIGDSVVIEETRPISSRKKFTLKQVTQTAGIEHVEAAPTLPEKEVPDTKPKANVAPKAKESTKKETA